MHDPKSRPPCEQVDAGSLQLSGAGTGEHEARAAGPLDQLVDNGQQLRHGLHLVNHSVSRIGRSGNQIDQTLGTGGMEPMLRWRDEVDP